MMSDFKLIDVFPMDPTFGGKPTPAVLRGFKVRIFERPEGSDYVVLSQEWFDNTLSTRELFPANEVDFAINSIFFGLCAGYACANYKKIGGIWVPKSKDTVKFF